MNDAGVFEHDMDLPVLHVAKGTMRVETGAMLLQATVGGEIAVAATCPGRRGGGLMHLSDYIAALTHPTDELPSRWAGGLTRFLEALAAQRRPVSHLTATIVGGADLLGLLTRTRHAEIAQAWTTALGRWLAERGLPSTAAIGGDRARLVSVDTHRGAVDIVPIGLGRSRAPGDGDPSTPGESETPRDTVIGIGDLRVDRSPHRLSTILGSCVGIAMFDPTTRIGGLAHAMMPRDTGEGGEPARFVDTAVAALTAAMVRAGAARRGIRAKIAGGARVLLPDSGTARFQVAAQNVAVAREALQAAGIPLVAQHVGGTRGRRLQVDLREFRISVRMLRGTPE